MKKWFIIYFSFLVIFFVNAQTKKIDSLYHVLKSAKQDTNQVKTLISLAFSLININDYKNALILNQKAILISNKIGYKKGLVAALVNIGITSSKQGYYEKSIETYTEALKLSENINDFSNVARITANIGLVYYSQANYAKALQCFFEAIKFYEKLNDKIGLSSVISNIGNIYYQQNNFLKALTYHIKGLKLSQEIGDSNDIAMSISCIGGDYEALDKYDKALECYLKALKIYEKNNDKQNIAASFINIGNNCHNKNDNNKAIEYFIKAIKLSEEISYREGTIISLNNLGNIYCFQKQYNQAETVLLKSLTNSKEIGDLFSIQQASQSLSELYQKQFKSEKALLYYKEYITVRDSINKKENIQKQVRLEMNFDFEKKQALQKIEQNKKTNFLKIENQKQVHRKNNLIYASIGLCLLLIISSLFIYFNSKQRQKISEQEKNVLEQKMLRAQMNPHFIFNSLGIIHNYIQTQKGELAGDYLVKFSKLMRLILENSRQDFISLEKEKETLTYYLNLNQLVVNNGFNYQINIDESIDQEITLIPPMLAQPFIENAIKHGISKGLKKGEIIINFKKINDIILFEVIDNGIGYTSTQIKQQQTNEKHHSLATQIVYERLSNINKRYSKKISITISDILDHLKQPSGTRVEFEIPFIYSV